MRLENEPVIREIDHELNQFLGLDATEMIRLAGIISNVSGIFKPSDNRHGIQPKRDEPEFFEDDVWKIVAGIRNEPRIVIRGLNPQSGRPHNYHELQVEICRRGVNAADPDRRILSLGNRANPDLFNGFRFYYVPLIDRTDYTKSAHQYRLDRIGVLRPATLVGEDPAQKPTCHPETSTPPPFPDDRYAVYKLKYNRDTGEFIGPDPKIYASPKPYHPFDGYLTNPNAVIELTASQQQTQAHICFKTADSGDDGIAVAMPFIIVERGMHEAY